MAFWDARSESVDAQGERRALSRPFVLVRVVGLSMSLAAVKGGGGSERPNSDVRWCADDGRTPPARRSPQQRNGRCNWSTRRKNTSSQRFQPNSRYTIRRDVRTIWHGNRMKAFTNVLNSIRNTVRLASRSC